MESANKISRRDFIKQAIVGTGAVIMAPEKELAAAVDSLLSERTVLDSKLEPMPDHNLAEGFSRSKIIATLSDDKKEKLVGSFFSMEDLSKAKAEFLTNDQHPEVFQNGINFEVIKETFSKQGKKIVMTVAAAYLSKEGNRKIEGIALEQGKMVGETKKSNQNGLLVIENGEPKIEFINQMADFDQSLKDAQKNQASLFQQTSAIRGDNVLQSSVHDKFELRFFVEGMIDGKPKKGIVNFSESMTYTEAIAVLKKTANFKIDKAIAFDTGLVSEGYFYEKNGTKHLMIDEKITTDKMAYTNVIVLYSQ